MKPWKTFLAALAFLWTHAAWATVAYRAEDNATVRVFAVRGVQEVEATTDKGAVVRVAVVDAGHGSGAIVTHDGLILTAQHVIEDAAFVAVSVPGDDAPKMAEVVYQSRRSDLAFLKVPGHYQDIIPIPNADPVLTVRQPLFALGYPLDGSRKEPQSTSGVLAAALPDGRLQLNMSINPGNSGGPVIDEKGLLVGVVVQRADPAAGAQGIAIAVPIATAMNLYQKAITDSAAYKAAVARETSLLKAKDAARIVAEVASVSSFVAAVAHIEHLDKSFSEAVARAADSHSTDPDFLALLASHYYNESLIRKHLNAANWVKPLAKARAFARSAFALDQAVTRRNPFLVRLLMPSEAKLAGKAQRTPPRRIMGFKLGSRLAEAERTCTLEGFTFEQTSKGYRCSEPPASDSMTGPVELRVCEGELICRIDVMHRPSKALGKVWIDAFHTWFERMQAHYGEPTSNVRKIPMQCRKRLLGCLETGEALLSYSWVWEGQKLVLGIGRLDGQATLRLSIVDTNALPRGSSPTQPTEPTPSAPTPAAPVPNGPAPNAALPGAALSTPEPKLRATPPMAPTP